MPGHHHLSRISAAPDPVKSYEPQLAFGVVCSPTRRIPEIQVPEDDALQGSPMDICWPTPMPGPTVMITSPGSPMSICKPSPVKRCPPQDSAIRGLSIPQPPPQPEHKNPALQCSFRGSFLEELREMGEYDGNYRKPPAFRPSPPRPPPSSPRPRPVASAVLVIPPQARIRTVESPLSPPGTFLEELREMGEYDGPTAVQRMAQALHITEQEVLDEWSR